MWAGEESVGPLNPRPITIRLDRGGDRMNEEIPQSPHGFKRNHANPTVIIYNEAKASDDLPIGKAEVSL